MDVTEFGSRLVTTGDLDPIYTMLNASKLPTPTLQRWVLAYWMFYHAGVSSLIANAPSNMFWSMVWKAQEEKWPRGTERRHFKAENSRKAIESLQRQWLRPEDAVQWVSAPGHRKLSRDLGHDVGDTRFREILRRAQSWVGFGPWIAFKIADMVDAVLHIPVDFTGAEDTFFDDPVAGAFCVAFQAGKLQFEVPMLDLSDLVARAKDAAKSMASGDRTMIVREATSLLKAGPLGKLRSPTNPERLLATQEYETIFCKYKSHLNGHYPVGKDTKEIMHMLTYDNRWGPLAVKLADALEKATS